MQWNMLQSVLASIHLGWIAGGVFVFCISLAIRSVRWHSVMRWMVPNVHPMVTLRPLYVGYLLNNVLPGKLGEIAKLVLISRGTQTTPITASMAIMVDRVVDGLGLGIVMGVAWWVSGYRDPLMSGVLLAGSGFFCMVAMGLFAVSHSPLLLRAVTGVFHWIRFPRGAEWVILGRDGLREIQSFRRLIWVMLLSILNWVTEAGAYVAVARALSIGVSSSESVMTMGMVSFGGVVLSTPGGIGAHEYLATTALSQFHIPFSESLAIALVVHLVLLIPPALLGFLSVITIGWGSVADTVVLRRK